MLDAFLQAQALPDDVHGLSEDEAIALMSGRSRFRP